MQVDHWKVRMASATDTPATLNACSRSVGDQRYRWGRTAPPTQAALGADDKELDEFLPILVQRYFAAGAAVAADPSGASCKHQRIRSGAIPMRVDRQLPGASFRKSSARDRRLLAEQAITGGGGMLPPVDDGRKS